MGAESGSDGSRRNCQHTPVEMNSITAGAFLPQCQCPSRRSSRRESSRGTCRTSSPSKDCHSISGIPHEVCWGTAVPKYFLNRNPGIFLVSPVDFQRWRYHYSDRFSLLLRPRINIQWHLFLCALCMHMSACACIMCICIKSNTAPGR